MITSHVPARSVLRTKPRRCAHHVYSTRASSSRATSLASRFSSPSPRAFEKGRLFGSAQTRSTRPSTVAADGAALPASSSVPIIAASPRARHAPRRAVTPSGKREDIERPSLLGVLRQVARRADEAVGGGRVARIEVVRDDRAGPAADAVEDGDVLPSVGPAVGDRLRDDAGRRAEAPEQLAGARVERLEPAVHRAVEDDVAGRRERAAP